MEDDDERFDDEAGGTATTSVFVGRDGVIAVGEARKRVAKGGEMDLAGVACWCGEREWLCD